MPWRSLGNVSFTETSHWELNGVPQPGSVSVKTDTIWGYTNKVSVDTGKFIPGIFRVNPYSIARGTYHCAGHLAEVRIVSDPLWTRVVRIDGTFTGRTEIQNALAAIPVKDQSTNRSITLQKSYAKVGRAQIEAGVELGELRETLAMLRNPLKDLREFLTKDAGKNLKLLMKLKSGITTFSSKELKQIAKAGSTPANTWLEFRYGIRPLVSSVSAILGYIKKAEAKAFNSKLIRSTHSEFKESVVAIQPKVTSYSNFAVFTSEMVSTDEYLVSTNVYYTLEYERTAAQHLGLSVEYIPEILWELTRLSFVVDWLFSVGSYLGSIRYKPGITILGNTAGIKHNRVVMVTTTVAADGIKSNDPPASSIYQSQTFDRVVNLPVPSTPFFLHGANLDLYKIIDAAALIVQPLLRKLR